jgi:hypothetical protein
MAIFNSYVKLPEGTRTMGFHGFWSNSPRSLADAISLSSEVVRLEKIYGEAGFMTWEAS